MAVVFIENKLPTLWKLGHQELEMSCYFCISNNLYKLCWMHCWRREISGALRPIWGIILGSTCLPDTEERGGVQVCIMGQLRDTQMQHSCKEEWKCIFWSNTLGCNYGAHADEHSFETPSYHKTTMCSAPKKTKRKKLKNSTPFIVG